MEITITKKAALKILDDFDQHREEIGSGPSDVPVFMIDGKVYRFKQSVADLEHTLFPTRLSDVGEVTCVEYEEK